MKRLLFILLPIAIFLTLGVILYESTKALVTVCTQGETGNCSKGEAIDNLSKILLYNNGEVITNTKCDIDNSKGICNGKSNKTSTTSWAVTITSKNNISIHRYYNN